MSPLSIHVSPLLRTSWSLGTYCSFGSQIRRYDNLGKEISKHDTNVIIGGIEADR